MDFRLNNAAKMYPGSYALVSPYGYDYRMQYGRSSPRYAHHVAPPPIQEVPPVYRQKQPVEPLYLPPYPVQASPQLSARAYRYDREAYINTTPEIVPPIPLRIERPFHEHAKYSWGASVRSHPIEPVGPQAHILLTTSSTQPGNTPRDGFFTPSWPRTVEVVKIEEQKREVGPVEEDLEKAEAGISSSKPTQEVVKQQPAKEAPVTPRSASSKRRAAAEKGPRPSKQNQPPERAEKGKEEPTVAPSKQPPSEQEVPPESEPQPETTEYAQQEESAVAKELKARDVAAVGGQKEPEASQESSSEEEDVKEREAKRDDEHEENDGTPDSDLPSSDEPVVAEETEGQGFRKDMDESLAMKSTGEDVKQNLPIFSVAISASTFAGPEVVTPRPVKVAGKKGHHFIGT